MARNEETMGNGEVEERREGAEDGMNTKGLTEGRSGYEQRQGGRRWIDRRDEYEQTGIKTANTNWNASETNARRNEGGGRKTT